MPYASDTHQIESQQLIESTDVTERLSSGVDDLHTIARLHGVPVGSPDRLIALPLRLSQDGRFRSDLTELIRSLQMRDPEFALPDALSVLILGVGGETVNRRSRDLEEAIDLTGGFLASVGGWPGSDVEPSIDIDHPPADDPRLELRRVAATQTQQVQASSSTFVISPEGGLAIAVPAADGAPPDGEAVALSEITQALARLERGNLELRLHLDSIDQRICRMEPLLEAETAAGAAPLPPRELPRAAKALLPRERPIGPYHPPEQEHAAAREDLLRELRDLARAASAGTLGSEPAPLPQPAAESTPPASPAPSAQAAAVKLATGATPRAASMPAPSSRGTLPNLTPPVSPPQGAPLTNQTLPAGQAGPSTKARNGWASWGASKQPAAPAPPPAATETARPAQPRRDRFAAAREIPGNAPELDPLYTGSDEVEAAPTTTEIPDGVAAATVAPLVAAAAETPHSNKDQHAIETQRSHADPPSHKDQPSHAGPQLPELPGTTDRLSFPDRFRGGDRLAFNTSLAPQARPIEEEHSTRVSDRTEAARSQAPVAALSAHFDPELTPAPAERLPFSQPASAETPLRQTDPTEESAASRHLGPSAWVTGVIAASVLATAGYIYVNGVPAAVTDLISGHSSLQSTAGSSLPEISRAPSPAQTSTTAPLSSRPSRQASAPASTPPSPRRSTASPAAPSPSSALAPSAAAYPAASSPAASSPRASAPETGTSELHPSQPAATENRVLAARQSFTPSETIESTPSPTFVPAGVMDGRLLSAPRPLYPKLASPIGNDTQVTLDVMISKSGTIEAVKAVGGNRLLRDAAANAVRQWQYRPFLVRGEPVEVRTFVRVDITPQDAGSSVE